MNQQIAAGEDGDEVMGEFVEQFSFHIVNLANRPETRFCV